MIFIMWFVYSHKAACFLDTTMQRLQDKIHLQLYIIFWAPSNRYRQKICMSVSILASYSCTAFPPSVSTMYHGIIKLQGQKCKDLMEACAQSGQASQWDKVKEHLSLAAQKLMEWGCCRNWEQRGPSPLPVPISWSKKQLEVGRMDPYLLTM